MRPIIAACSLWQPWASLVAFEEKMWETRGRRMFTNMIGQLLAIASTKKSPDTIGWNEIEMGIFSRACYRISDQMETDDMSSMFPSGCVLSIHRIIQELPVEAIRDKLSQEEIAFGNYTDGRFATRLELLERFETPIPCKGAQGIWKWERP